MREPLDTRRIGYGLVLFAFGALALDLSAHAGLAGLPLVWVGVAYLFVGVLYLAARPGWLGKRPDGTQSALRFAVALPYLGAVWVAWRLRRRLAEPAWHEIAPGLFLGRRCTARELPPALDLIVDVTAELPSIRAPASRALMPILDGCAPRLTELSALIDAVAEREGRLFVHCLAGHGRSAMVMAALLLARGLAASPDDAVRRLKAVRRGIHIAPGQRAALDAWHSATGARAAP